MSELKNSTAIATAFADIAKAVKAHDGRMAQLVAPLVQANIDPHVALKPEGEWYDDFRAGVAAAYLTTAQAAAVLDPAVSGKAKVGKLTKADLTKRLSSSVSKVRTAVIKAMGAAKGTGAGAGGGQKADPLTAMHGRLERDWNTLADVRAGKAKAPYWKAFEGDVTEAYKALDVALKALEELKKDEAIK